MPALKRTRVILSVSLWFNAILLGVLAYREVDYRVQRVLWESEAPGWATYAGAMQAIADYGKGVRRMYRLTLAKDENARSSFTGQVDHGREVWTWIYYRELGEASRLSAVAFTEAYNARMLNFMKDPASHEKNGIAGTRPAETRRSHE